MSAISPPCSCTSRAFSANVQFPRATAAAAPSIGGVGGTGSAHHWCAIASARGSFTCRDQVSQSINQSINQSHKQLIRRGSRFHHWTLQVVLLSFPSGKVGSSARISLLSVTENSPRKRWNCAGQIHKLVDFRPMCTHTRAARHSQAQTHSPTHPPTRPHAHTHPRILHTHAHIHLVDTRARTHTHTHTGLTASCLLCGTSLKSGSNVAQYCPLRLGLSALSPYRTPYRRSRLPATCEINSVSQTGSHTHTHCLQLPVICETNSSSQTR